MAALTSLLGGTDVTLKLDMESVVMNLAGSQETATCEADILDVGNSVVATEESTFSMTEVGTAEVLFGGFVRSSREIVIATGRIIHIMAADYNSLLDRSIVVSDSRTAGESDHARLIYFMSTYGTQFSSDYSKIGTLNGSMVAQKFIALTLRQALERVMGQASSNASYFIDPLGRLNYVDRTSVTAAPYNVRVGTPGGGEIAPEDFEFDRDSSNLSNAIYVVGATAAGSGWVTDVTSIAAYGRRERFVNAPDSDTFAKMTQVGNATLTDQKNPLPRGVFTAKSPYDGWRVGQSIVVTSAQHGLSGVTLRIAKVTVKYLSGVGDREYTIELGAPLPTISALLGSTFGAGGGFPWHSPGGPFHWPGLMGGGGPGGAVSGAPSCGCLPYVASITDSFNRANTAFNGGLGTADVGTAWVGASGCQIFNLQAYVGSSGGDNFSTETTLPVAIPMPIPHVNLNLFSNDDRMWFAVKFNGGGIRAEASFGRHGLYSDVQITLSDGTNSVSASYGVTQTYPLQAQMIVTADTVRIIAGSGDLTINRTAASPGPIAALTTAHDLIMGGAGSDGGRVVFDTLDIAGVGDSVPSPGQPYPQTSLATGNGVTTTFTTLTPYQPGSLRVFIDNVLVIPIAQVPSTGGFTLNFAPSSLESISAAWTVA